MRPAIFDGTTGCRCPRRGISRSSAKRLADGVKDEKKDPGTKRLISLLLNHRARHLEVAAAQRLKDVERESAASAPYKDEMDGLQLSNQNLDWVAASYALTVVKTGGRLVKHARYYWLLLAESHLTRRLFGAMLQRIVMLPVPAG
jgi:hypothetical protein